MCVAAYRGEHGPINQPPEEAHQMLTKTRTTLITLIAACSFATATIAPAVSQAEPPGGSASATGCGGTSRVGDEITVTVTVKRGAQSVSKSYTEKCESDGKWHIVASVVSNPVAITPSVVVARLTMPVL
jgi:hypothetical protein